jgi:hypothetical protein
VRADIRGSLAKRGGPECAKRIAHSGRVFFPATVIPPQLQELQLEPRSISFNTRGSARQLHRDLALPFNVPQCVRRGIPLPWQLAISTAMAGSISPS